VASLVVNLALVAWLWQKSRTLSAPLPPGSSSRGNEAVIRPPAPTGPSLATGPYASLGSFMAENNQLPRLGWTEAQFAEFLTGFRASYEGHPVPLSDEARRLQENISARVQAMLANSPSPSSSDPVEEYFHALREKEGVSRTGSGLHYRITETAEGPKPRPTDTVEISFGARLPGGQSVPALSRTRNRSVVRDLLPGLAEGVQLLSVGGKALIYVPPTLSFSETDWPPQLPKGVPLVFFVELHDINPTAAP
jgi:FKBP-type peptidyl-prolyl cis-trans isomerase FkpA